MLNTVVPSGSCWSQGSVVSKFTRDSERGIGNESHGFNDAVSMTLTVMTSRWRQSDMQTSLLTGQHLYL